MTPITRKENYLNEIVGWGETAPEKPLTPEEFFFAAILGEAVQTPEPLSRYQIYLAKIAGRNISVPKPLTRLELFLAKACGMDIETPTPITREEIFWSNYTAIVELEVEGAPPLSFKAKKAGELENYRIYGNTVGGESVGDLVTSGEHAGEYNVPVTVTNGTGTETTNIYLPEPIKMVGDEAEYIDYAEQKQHRVRKNLVSSYLVENKRERYANTLWCEIDFKPNTEYILDFIYAAGAQFYTNEYVFETVNYTNTLGGKRSLKLKTKSTIDKNSDNQYVANKGWIILKNNKDATEDIEISDIQIRLATIKDDTYEPYIENTDLDVTLPALPTLPRANVLSVGTAVQPSKVYVKYKGERQ